MLNIIISDLPLNYRLPIETKYHDPPPQKKTHRTTKNYSTSEKYLFPFVLYVVLSRRKVYYDKEVLL
jgi:hypothetical protein